jgi:adsorption protein B
MVEWIPYLWLILKVILVVVAVVFFISGLDDLFIDIYYALRSLYRRLFVAWRYQPLTEEQLLAPPEQAIAVMIPAWQEAPVIRRMLENTVQTFKYSNYHIFVGTYPNDPDTQDEVEVVREKYDHVHRIVCPKNGPTNKADCLNWIYQGILAFEHDNNMQFAIFVMEDAEDIVHPLALKLFNYLIPRKDMVQIPVIAFECSWLDFTCGHYLDEFSENHFKNLVVREFFAKNIPSAGVGCAFSRRAFELAAAQNQNQLFSIDSLTEDYEIGLRLANYNLKTIFVKQAFRREVYRKSFWRQRPYKKVIKDYIAVREYFPKDFRASVRQKARWVVGITLQGWVHLGWQGGLRSKYMLYRDRKTLLTSQANMLGYFVVIGILIYWFFIWYFPEAYHYPPLVSSGTWLYYLILADTFFMFVRLVERFFAVHHFYGWGQAFVSIPRFVWGNVINFAATCRALYLFGRYLWTGKLIAWDKTDHVLPTEEELRRYRRKLGDLLLEKKFITLTQLKQALEEQKKRQIPLGALLVQMGLVREDDLIHVLGQQLQLETQEIDPYRIPLEVIQALPRQLAVRYSLFPLEISDNKLVAATQNLLSPEELADIEGKIGKRLELRLATRSDLSFAIRMGYDRLQPAPTGKLDAAALANLLLERQLVPVEVMAQALKMQRRSYVRLGDILVDQGVLSNESLQEAIKNYSQQPEMQLGDFLIQQQLLTEGQLQRALAIQKAKMLTLGEVLVSMGALSPFFGEVLKLAEAGHLDGSQVQRLLEAGEPAAAISPAALENLAALLARGRLSSADLTEVMVMLADGRLSPENLEKVLDELEHGTVGITMLLEELLPQGMDRSHADR